MDRLPPMPRRRNRAPGRALPPMQSGHGGFAPMPALARNPPLPDPIEGLAEEAIYGGGIRRTRAARQIAAGFGPNKPIEPEPRSGAWMTPVSAPRSSKQHREWEAEDWRVNGGGAGQEIAHMEPDEAKRVIAERATAADARIAQARKEIEAIRKERKERIARIARERWEL
jgi:hypothetical protein